VNRFRPSLCYVKIIRKKRKHLSEITNEEIRKLGFNSLSELLNALKECYDFIPDFLWIYEFKNWGVRVEMLDKTEIKFLRKTEAFNPEYRHILRLRIRRKISRLKDALRLLMESEFSNEIALFITENCSALQNSVTPEI